MLYCQSGRHLQELVAEAATAIGRSADDVRPFLKTLEEISVS